jgi:hypothetical protein
MALIVFEFDFWVVYIYFLMPEELFITITLLREDGAVLPLAMIG